MHTQHFPDLELRKLNTLILAYCNANPSIRHLYNFEPSMADLVAYASQREFSDEAYDVLSDALTNQYSGYLPIEAVNENLAAFKSRSAITVTTGHQLCLLGGPAFMICKILSTIKLAQTVQANFADKKVVPVFWLASEDHDREEIDHTFVHGKRLQWNTTQTGAVGRFATDGFAEVLEEWLAEIQDESFRHTMTALWNRASQFASWAELTKSWVHECFGEWGLVVINPDDARLKRLFLPHMRVELLQQKTHKAVTTTNADLLQMGFQAQVNPREINLFYLADGSRLRIEREGETWQTTDQLRVWSEDQLIDALDAHPENFSPNVLLRPLYQETILPNIAYVGGPGEVAYWLQLRSMFQEFQTVMPVVILRNSLVVLSSVVGKRMVKLGLNAADLFKPKELLIAQLVGDKPDFSEEKQQLEQVYERIASRIASVDPTLRATAMAELQRVQTGIDQLQGKAWKAAKNREEQKLATLDKVWEEVYPNSQWQERTQNMLSLALANDKELMRVLLNEFAAPNSTTVVVEC
jgi:bacillithiol biosynthesis cysteine-adding enzyme BshC